MKTLSKQLAEQLEEATKQIARKNLMIDHLNTVIDNQQETIVSF